MAVRLNLKHSEQVLERIKLSQLLNRLQQNGLGTLKSPKGEPYSLSRSEVTSITWLLERKLARAEAPRELKVSGELTLVELIKQASSATDA